MTKYLEGAGLPILEELKRFQNDDGGFGNAIESDFRLPIHHLWPLQLELGFYLK